jgi:UPF0176 protein
MQTLNISAYKFIGLEDLPALREALLAWAHARALKGTILLAPEGINLFLAGAAGDVRAFVAGLQADARFADIAPKESWSAEPPFKRMRVRLKKEIITMRQPLVQPETGRAPSLPPSTLARWLANGADDEGRDVVLLDTRNDYEVAAGTFDAAVQYGLRSFTEFPAAVAADRARFDGKTVVSFCTGGIRCEKAAIHMQSIGMDHVYQLDGGVLKYFEEVGGAHWRGDCFVFDDRGAVDPGLRPAHAGG